MAQLSRRRLAEYTAGRLALGDASVQTLARQLAAYLIENKQLHQIDMLLRDIEEVLAAKFDTVTAQVATVQPLTDDLRMAITNFVQQRTKARKVELQESIDPTLIGGITIQTPDSYFDGSVRSQLQQLTATKEKE
ncbi:MAG TPA: ATP synthase F1 subunit delta [Candidatus Saccharimonadales bacterium]